MTKSRVSPEGRECLGCGEFKEWGEFYKVTPAAKYRHLVHRCHHTRCKICAGAEQAARRPVPKWRVLRGAFIPYFQVKQCNECLAYRSLAEFHTNKDGSGGVHGKCKDCLSRRNREWRQSNGLAVRKYSRDYYKRHSYTLKTRSSARRLERAYGVSLEWYQEQYRLRRGRCDLCSVHKKPVGSNARPLSTLHVDHCHETGKIRGLLCWQCNTSLGKLGDTPEALEKAYRYTQGEVVVQ